LLIAVPVVVSDALPLSRMNVCDPSLNRARLPPVPVVATIGLPCPVLPRLTSPVPAMITLAPPSTTNASPR
jgi:hypothetical protein